MGTARITRTDDVSDVLRAYERPALRLAYLLTGDARVAEQVAAEALVTVGRGWRRGEVTDLSAALRRGVVRAATTVRPRHRRQPASRGRPGRRAGPGPDAEAPRDPVWRALQQLPDAERQALVLRYHEDLSDTEIAAALGIGVAAARTRLARGTARVEQLLGAAMGGA